MIVIVIIMAGVVESLCAIGNNLCMERDWVGAGPRFCAMNVLAIKLTWWTGPCNIESNFESVTLRPERQHETHRLDLQAHRTGIRFGHAAVDGKCNHTSRCVSSAEHCVDRPGMARCPKVLEKLRNFAQATFVSPHEESDSALGLA